MKEAIKKVEITFEYGGKKGILKGTSELGKTETTEINRDEQILLLTAITQILLRQHLNKKMYGRL